MSIVSALSESPVEDGIDALITEFVKVIGKIIEHSFWSPLALFQV